MREPFLETRKPGPTVRYDTRQRCRSAGGPGKDVAETPNEQTLEASC